MENLFKGLEYIILQKGDTQNFSGIEYDSRKVKEGDIFVALVGAVVDGHDYIDKAIDLGAKCIIVSKEVRMQKGITYVKINDLRRNLGIIGSNFYGWPQKNLKIVGVTGTNGKTTSTYIIESILGEDKVARLGTIEYKIGNLKMDAPNTTPESLDIVKFCKKAKDKKIPYLVMEISSHALDFGRVDMLDFDVAMFTNLTQDHLDYHKNMENYYAAKRKLFTKLKPSCKNNSVINIDDEWGEKLYQEFVGTSYSINKTSDIQGRILEFHADGQLVEITIDGVVYKIKLAILGRFNLYNILGTIGMALKLGISKDVIFKRIEKLKGAPGRFELVSCKRDFIAVIDYAHTPDALENIIKNINELKKGRIITIFGCGGDRDNTKRPIMGEIATSLSDITILTSDNPRTEDPDKILEDVEKGMKGEYLVIKDREQAIIKAVSMAQKDDIILVAGKGHETYQIVGRKKIHFDDKEYLRREMVKN